MIKDSHGWKGTFIIETPDGKETIHNRVMNAALDELLKPLQGIAPNLEIKYLALGTSSTAITDTDTKLGAEIFRTQFTTKTKTGTGQLTSVAVVLDSEAVAIVEEIGVFGGSGATAAANSGTLISRILWHRNKTANEQIQFTRIDQIVRG
jgi:hypothetical protein